MKALKAAIKQADHRLRDAHSGRVFRGRHLRLRVRVGVRVRVRVWRVDRFHCRKEIRERSR